MSWIGPDTYEPTVTDLTGFTVPVAVTVATIGPLSTGAVTYVRAASSPPSHQVASSTGSASAAVTVIQKRRRGMDVRAARRGRCPTGAAALTVER